MTRARQTAGWGAIALALIGWGRAWQEGELATQSLATLERISEGYAMALTTCRAMPERGGSGRLPSPADVVRSSTAEGWALVSARP